MASGILKQISKQTGLVYDKKRNILHGIYRGFPTTVKQTKDASMVVTVGAKKPNATDNEATVRFLNELKQNISQVKQAIGNETCIKCVVKSRIYKKNLGFTLETLEKVLSFCSSNGMVPCCQNCGEQTQTSVMSVDGEPFILCNTCCLDVQNGVEEVKAEIKDKKVNYFGGIVGAFLGSLVGVVLWVIIYHMGYIAAVSGLAFAICTIKGFEMFGGKLNVPGVIISLVIAVGMLYIAENIAFALEIFNEFGSMYEITYFDAYRSIPDFMIEPEVKAAVYKDLAMGYFMMLIASVSPVISTFKSMNNIIEVTKLDRYDEKVGC